MITPKTGLGYATNNPAHDLCEVLNDLEHLIEFVAEQCERNNRAQLRQMEHTRDVTAAALDVLAMVQVAARKASQIL